MIKVEPNFINPIDDWEELEPSAYDANGEPLYLLSDLASHFNFPIEKLCDVLDKASAERVANRVQSKAKKLS